MAADDATSFFSLAREITSRPAPTPNAPTLYAEKGALISPGYREHATKLYSDPARTRWVMVVYRQLLEGEVVEGDGLKWHPITWGKPRARAA